MTSFDNLLERSYDPAETVSLGEFYDAREDDKMLEMLNNAAVDESGFTNEIVVDEDYVIEQLYEDDPVHERARGGFEDVMKFFGENYPGGDQYEKGKDKAEGKMREIRSKYNDWRDQQDAIEDKAESKDKLVKLSEAGMGLGGLGTYAGLQAGEPNLAGPSSIVAFLSAYKNPEWQGMRDREVTEAVKGWNDAYGSYRVRVD